MANLKNNICRVIRSFAHVMPDEDAEDITKTLLFSKMSYIPK